MKTVGVKSRERRVSKPFKSLPDRTIQWFGSVDYKNLEKAIGEIKVLLTGNHEEEIHLLVNSHGGVTGTAMTFFDTVKSILKPNLVTIGSGDVDSSGIIIFVTGKRRYLTKNTTLLLHLAGRHFDNGKRFTVREMEGMLNEDRLKDFQYACVLADATEGKCTPERFLEMMEKNTILTPDEAVNLGLAHKVLP